MSDVIGSVLTIIGLITIGMHIEAHFGLVRKQSNTQYHRSTMKSNQSKKDQTERTLR